MIYKFEDFELNTEQQELFRAGVSRKLQPQVFALLELLVSNHHRIVTKDEINERIWGGRIVSESVVNSRIYSVRQAVDDGGKTQRLIKTVHSRGFRFIAEPKLITHRASPSEAVLENEPGHDISDTIGSDEEVNRLLARPPFGISSIAVLPFQNMSENLEHHHFVDGICEDIITALTKVPRLFVLGRVSLSNYRDRPVDIQAIGRELDVQYVLEGSVRCSDNRFRITAQLIETSTGDHIWAERFDREMQNIFALQDEMTREVITALQVELVDGEDARLWSSGTTNYQAWEAVMKARELCLTRRKFNVIAGRKLAQKAIALDENYGGAWNWLGYSYWAETLGGWSDDTVLALSLAKEAAERGLEIDETNAGMLGLLALVMISMRQYETANELAHRAIEFGPNNNYAIGCAGAIKMYCNELELAESMLRKAMKLAPLYKAGNPEILAATLMLMKRYDEAIVAANECLELDPDYFYAYCTLAIVYCELGRDQDAALAARNILRINPEYTVQTFAVHQPFQDKESLNRCLAGLRKAGIPEG